VIEQNHRPETRDMAGIVRQASVYDWLMGRHRIRRRPAQLPPHLHADLGLPCPEPGRAWSGWHPFG